MAACAQGPIGSQHEAIVGGVIDGSDNGVVGIFISPPGSTFGVTCSGIVVGQRTVLTAAHCVQQAVSMGFPKTPGFTAHVWFGYDEGSPTSTIDIQDVRIHRGYDPTSSEGDLALLLLAQDAAAAPLLLNAQDISTKIKPNTDKVTIVGYGNNDATHHTGLGTKHEVDALVDTIAAETLVVGTKTAEMCLGDSGGPALAQIDGQEVVVGINIVNGTYNPTSTDCVQQGISIRVDKFLNDFIYPAIDAWEGTCKLDGTCVTTDCRSPDPDCDPCLPDGTCASMCDQPDWDCPLGLGYTKPCETKYDCESRICVTAPDDPRVKYCSQTCDPANNMCGTGIDCVAQPDGRNACQFEAPSPSAQGSTCNVGTDCRSGICDQAFHICIEMCDPTMANSCPAPYVCAPSTDTPHACLPARPSSGGICDVSLGGRGPAPWVVLAFISGLTWFASRKRGARRV